MSGDTSRNHVPWIVIGICVVCRMILMITIRTYLSWENKRRDKEVRDTKYDDVYIDIGHGGEIHKVHLEKVCT